MFLVKTQPGNQTTQNLMLIWICWKNSHSPMSEKSSGTWKKTFCIPTCRKSLPVPRMRHFTFLHAIKDRPLEGGLTWLHGPEFSGIGKCKSLLLGSRRLFRMAAGKKATARISCCNIHNAITPAAVKPTTGETLTSAWVPARAWVKTREWTPVTVGLTTDETPAIAWMPATS